LEDAISAETISTRGMEFANWKYLHGSVLKHGTPRGRRLPSPGNEWERKSCSVTNLVKIPGALGESRPDKMTATFEKAYLACPDSLCRRLPAVSHSAGRRQSRNALSFAERSANLARPSENAIHLARPDSLC
jgi:hypothetical protein